MIIQGGELVGITIESNPVVIPVAETYWFYSYSGYSTISSAMDVPNDVYISLNGTGNGIQKISSAGASQARVFSGNATTTEFEAGRGLRVDNGGNIFGASTVSSNIRYGKVNNALNAVHFCKVIYQTAGGSSSNSESVQDLGLDPDGTHFYMCGSGRDADNNQQLSAFKIDAFTGNVAWAKTYAATPNGNSSGEMSKIDFDSGGNLWISASVEAPNQTTSDSASMGIFKIDKATGDILAQYIYNSTNSQTERARTMCIDSTGNIILAGSSNDTGLIIKVYPGNGAIAWQQRTSGFTDFWAVDTDSNNDIYVGFTGGQRPIAKLHSSNGNIVWSNKITIAGTNGSFENLQVVGNSLYAYATSIGTNTLLAKLPLDGSGLGTYVANVGNIVYQAQANAFSAGNLSLVTGNLTVREFGALSANVNTVTFFSNTTTTNSSLNNIA
jgi:hypothetical protein